MKKRDANIMLFVYLLRVDRNRTVNNRRRPVTRHTFTNKFDRDSCNPHDGLLKSYDFACIVIIGISTCTRTRVIRLTGGRFRLDRRRFVAGNKKKKKVTKEFATRSVRTASACFV